MKERKCYQCGYCETIDLNKEVMAAHELKCCFNPANKACVSCEYYSKERIENDPDNIKGKRSVCKQGFSVAGVRRDGKNKRILRTRCDYWIRKSTQGEVTPYV